MQSRLATHRIIIEKIETAGWNSSNKKETSTEFIQEGASAEL